MKKTASRPAFTLFEITVVLALLGLVMTLVITTVIGLFKMENVEAISSQRLSAHLALADRFRADVARAIGAPDKMEKFSAGDRCLILRNHDRSAIVYSWDKNQLMRWEITPASQSKKTLPVPGDQAAVEFHRSGPDQRLLTLRVVQTRRHGPAYVVEFAAALGGDLQ